LLKEKFSTIDQEIAAMQKVAEETARVEEKDIVAEGKRLASHIREESQRVFEAEVEKARQAISQEILEIVKGEVAQKIKLEVTETAQHGIISSQLNHLKAVQAIS
jgi:vacuolar-type H+-ATPase subunit E/Vma4